MKCAIVRVTILEEDVAVRHVVMEVKEARPKGVEVEGFLVIVCPEAEFECKSKVSVPYANHP